MIQKVLITGASGFIGRSVTRSFAELGVSVIGLSRSDSIIDKTYKNVSFYDVDLRDKERMLLLLKSFKPDAVIHLAAIASPTHGLVSEIYDVNVLGSECLLDAVQDACTEGTKVILASTAGVYGNSKQELISEDAAYSPVNHYSLSKVAMELLSKCYEDSFDIKIVRPFNVIGVGQRENFLVPKLVKAFIERRKVIEVGNIETLRDYVDVSFASEVITKLTLNETFPSKVLNICSGKGTSGVQMIDSLREITGFNPEVIVKNNLVRQKEINRLVGDPCKVNEFIGNHTSSPVPHILLKMLEARR